MTKIGMYNIVVKAVVLDKNKVLLLKRSDYQKAHAHEWDLPGGRLEPGEDPNEAIHREIYEETGLKVKLGQPYEIVKWYSEYEKVDKVAITYLAKYISGKLKTSHEHELGAWYNIDKIPKDMTKWIRKSLREAKKII